MVFAENVLPDIVHQVQVHFLEQIDIADLVSLTTSFNSTELNRSSDTATGRIVPFHLMDSRRAAIPEKIGEVPLLAIPTSSPLVIANSRYSPNESG